MVGHTHEDIDQMFSCISSYLRRNSIHDLQGNSVETKFLVTAKDHCWYSSTHCCK